MFRTVGRRSRQQGHRADSGGYGRGRCMMQAGKIALLLAIASTCPSASHAQVLETFYEPVPVGYSEFGSALSVGGTSMAVSADVDGRAGGPRRVHLFDLVTGQHLLQIDTPPSPPNRTYFGSALAHVGPLLAVGSRGYVDIFDGAPGSPTFGAHLRTLDAPQPDAVFGLVLSKAGDLLLVGGGGPFVHAFNPATGALVRSFGSGISRDGFGESLAASGNLVVVGAPKTTVQGLAEAGAAYVFRLDTGEVVATLLPPEVLRDGLFGTSVAFHDGLVAVGAINRFLRNPPGAVHLFEPSSGSLELTIQSPTAFNDDYFGSRLVADEERLVVTAGWTFQRGTVFVFLLDSAVPPQIIQNPGSAAYTSGSANFFGGAIGLFRDDVVVGAPKNQYSPVLGNVERRAGAVYLFEGIQPAPAPTPSPKPVGPTPTGPIAPTPTMGFDQEEIVAIVEQPTCKGVSGVSNIQGIVYSTREDTGIKPLVKVTFDEGSDTESALDLSCCSSRGDAPVLSSGFAGVFNWCLLEPGLHTITLEFQSTSGKKLKVSRMFRSYCEHPHDTFLKQGEFNWGAGDMPCETAEGGVIVCSPSTDICDGEIRYEWSQATQGLVLKSNCEVDGFNPVDGGDCSDELIVE